MGKKRQAKMKQAPSNFYFAGQAFVNNIIEREPELEVLMDGNSIASIKPAETLFGYSYHSHCVPPYKPSEILILGYGGGQIAELIRKVWGNVKITSVDSQKLNFPYLEHKMYTTDAYDFVKDCTNSIIKKRYDYIVVDLFDGDEVPEFVFEPEFATRLAEMTKTLLCLNTRSDDFNKLKPYSDYGFQFHRHVQIFSNTVSYWGR